jgi:predicted MFS family arabinose efflux permease
MTIGALCYTIGSLVTGRFVRKFGRKTITIIAIFLASIFTIIFTLSSNLWLAVATDFLGAWFFGMSVSAGQSLNLEQVQTYRGTMMSLTSAVGSTGSAFGAGLGGLVILQYGYEILGLSLGIFGIASSIIFHFLASDPTRD